VKSVEYMSAATAELAEAALYYEQQQAGIGADFLKAVEAAVQTIQQNPEMWPVWQKPVRSFRLARFPFRLFYWELANIIQVVAVAHLSREPGYWQNRVR